MREYEGERAVRYEGIRRRTGDALCGNTGHSVWQFDVIDNALTDIRALF